MSTDGDDKTLLERLLEVGVYAPVGFLVTRSRTVPDLAQAGRRQIAFARSLGRAALKSFARGIRRDEPIDMPPNDHGAPVEAEIVDDVAGAEVIDAEVVDEPIDAGTDDADPIEVEAAAIEEFAAPGEESAAPGEESGEIDGYDELSAREIIELVKTGDARRARWVHDRETANKGRVTVLRAAAKALG